MGELTRGVEDGTIKFTKKGDAKVVARIYETAFETALSGADELDFSSLGWGDDDIIQLASSFAFYASRNGPLVRLKRLELRDNMIGDRGLEALANVASRQYLPNLH